MTEGHCHCGETRFAFPEDQLRWQGICHCSDCRRATGAPMVGWFGVPDAAWHWSGAAPAKRETKPGTWRWFCASCGSQMAFYSDRWPDEMHGTAACLADPSKFKPTFHCYTDERLAWVVLDDELKQFPKAAG